MKISSVVAAENALDLLNKSPREHLKQSEGRAEKKEVKETGVREIEKTGEVLYKKENLLQQIEGLNEITETHNRGIKFKYHEGLKRHFVEVIDKNTNEVVKEIPPEKFLDMISSMLEYVGLIVDEKV